MTDASALRPGDVADPLAYALRFDGSRHLHPADDIMARVTARYLIRHLERSGFVLMREPPDAATTAIMPSSIG